MKSNSLHKGEEMMTTIDSSTQAQGTIAPTAPLISMGFNFSVPSEELHETIDAWTSYIERLSKEISRDPQLKTYMILALLRRGIAYAVLKEWDAAIADFKRVIDEQAGAEEIRAARMMLGGIYTEQYRDQEAIACWSSVLAELEQASRKEAKLYAEQFPRLYLYRGMLHGRLKQYQDAIADCDRAQKYAPENAEIYSVRGISYAYLGDLERALSDCLHAVELEQRASVYNRLGEVHFMRHEYQQSFAAFDRAVDLDPTDEAIHLNRSKALVYMAISLFEGNESAQGVEANCETNGTGEEQQEIVVD
jgi:tetratricopeptide (TPR) repeat protein